MMMPPVGKSGPRHVLHKLLGSDGGVFQECQTSVDDFTKIVRGNVCRHADGNAARAIDQQIGKSSGKNCGLALGVVVVVLKIDGVVFQVLQKCIGNFLKPDLCITHRRGRVAIHRAEIALAIDQRLPHGEVLHHADEGIVNGLVAVRMVFTDHVTDDARRFAIGLIPLIARLMHRVQDAAVHRLQPIPDIRKRARNNYAHRVIEIGALHFVGD